MDCPVCWGLKQAYDAAAIEYITARSSACFRVCLNVAARKNVEMERARYEFEEYRRGCVSSAKPVALVPKQRVPTKLKRLVA
jgi:hypothetical protein